MGSLVVVGTGIKSISHLSVEAITYIQQSDKVLYSVNEPVIEEWIKENNANVESLDVPNKTSLRRKTYQNITEYILKHVRAGKNVCTVFYGHPTVFADAALDAAKQSVKEGMHTLVLPAISAESCLYADLLIDPASSGCHSYEATDLLIRKRSIDITSHLILWQVGIIGILEFPSEKNNTKKIEVLRNYLLQYYNPKHEMIAYEASLYPHLKPLIIHFELQNMLEIKFTALTTLYIPPAYQNEIDILMLEELEINKNDLI